MQVKDKEEAQVKDKKEVAASRASRALSDITSPRTWGTYHLAKSWRTSRSSSWRFASAVSVALDSEVPLPNRFSWKGSNLPIRLQVLRVQEVKHL